MHVFRAEKATVLWESLSIGRRRFKWPEEQRINGTFSEKVEAAVYRRIG
jgi:hypothetical protein